jgi:hypothetical protein
MMLYVAIVAIVNLALGYALATFLGGGTKFEPSASDLVDVDADQAEPAY